MDQINFSRAFHALPVEEVLEVLDSSSRGLNTEEAASRRKVFGANRLPEPPKRSALLRFLSHFRNLLTMS